MLGFMDLRWPMVARRSNVGAVILAILIHGKTVFTLEQVIGSLYCLIFVTHCCTLRRVALHVDCLGARRPNQRRGLLGPEVIFVNLMRY